MLTLRHTRLFSIACAGLCAMAFTFSPSQVKAEDVAIDEVAEALTLEARRSDSSDHHRRQRNRLSFNLTVTATDPTVPFPAGTVITAFIETERDLILGTPLTLTAPSAQITLPASSTYGLPIISRGGESYTAGVQVTLPTGSPTVAGLFSANVRSSRFNTLTFFAEAKPFVVYSSLIGGPERRTQVSADYIKIN